MREDFNGVPDHFQLMHSTQFWFYLDNDFIEKIVALRVFPYQDRIALKILPRNSHMFISVLIRDTELRILKRLWDCEHTALNEVLKEYLTYSSSCFQQWVKRTPQNHGCFDWYMDLNVGKKK